MTKSQIVLLELEVDRSSVVIPKQVYSESIRGESVTDLQYCNGHIFVVFQDGTISEFCPFVRRTFFGFPLSSVIHRSSSSPIRLMRYDEASNYLYTLLENERICVYSVNADSLTLLDTIENITEVAPTPIQCASDWTLVGLDFLPYGLCPFPVLVATTRNGTRFFLCVRDGKFQRSLLRFSSQNDLIVNATAIVGSTFVQTTASNQVFFTTRCTSPHPVYLEVSELLKRPFPAIEHVYSLPEPQMDRKCSRHQCELRFW